MAKVISVILLGEIRPSFRINLWRSIPRNCNVSTAETLVNPLLAFGLILTCQKLGAK